MNKICTDIKQSKKLIELGIDVNTADLTVIDLPIQNGDRFKFINNKLPGDIFPSITDGKSEKIPAWSLSALLDILPTGKVLLHDKGNRGYKCICNNIDTYFHDNPIDACYEMIIRLYELKML